MTRVTHAPNAHGFHAEYLLGCHWYRLGTYSTAQRAFAALAGEE